jgi:hypothetical protein
VLYVIATSLAGTIVVAVVPAAIALLLLLLLFKPVLISTLIAVSVLFTIWMLR